MIDIICQVAILIFGATAIWVVGRPESWSKYGFILGCCSQPFWIVTSFMNEQWGIFALSLWYSYSWAQGVHTHFFRGEDD